MLGYGIKKIRVSRVIGTTYIFCFGLSPYLVNIFCPKNVDISTYIFCIYSLASQTTFIMEANTMHPDQTTPHGSSLIWVYTVCNISYHSISA